MAPRLFLLVALSLPSCASSTSSPEATPTAPTAVSTATLASCAPQQFTKSFVSCCGLASFFWDGQRCQDASTQPGKCGCACDGPDCGNLFSSMEACQQAHLSCR